MNKKAKILFFCMIIVGKSSFSQKIPISTKAVAIKVASIKSRNVLTVKENTGPQNSFYIPMLKAAKAAEDHQSLKPPVTQTAYSIPSDFYTQNFGFFCRKELQIEKATKIPFKFRLGSVQQCDWLEGKPNTRMR